MATQDMEEDKQDFNEQQEDFQEDNSDGSSSTVKHLSYANALTSSEGNQQRKATTDKLKQTRLSQTFKLYRIEPENITVNEVINDKSFTSRYAQSYIWCS